MNSVYTKKLFIVLFSVLILLVSACTARTFQQLQQRCGNKGKKCWKATWPHCEHWEMLSVDQQKTGQHLEIHLDGIT